MKSSSMTPDAAHPDKRVPIPKGFSLNDAPYPNDRERANEFPSVFFSPPPPAGPIGALVGFLGSPSATLQEMKTRAHDQRVCKP